MVPKVDVFRCDGCGACVRHCPPQIIGLVKNKAAILVDLCEECGICAEACSTGAIHFKVPNVGTALTHEAYMVAREFTPNPGNWTTGVPRGHDGKGHHKRS